MKATIFMLMLCLFASNQSAVNYDGGLVMPIITLKHNDSLSSKIHFIGLRGEKEDVFPLELIFWNELGQKAQGAWIKQQNDTVSVSNLSIGLYQIQATRRDEQTETLDFRIE